MPNQIRKVIIIVPIIVPRCAFLVARRRRATVKALALALRPGVSNCLHAPGAVIPEVPAHRDFKLALAALCDRLQVEDILQALLLDHAPQAVVDFRVAQAVGRLRP